MSVIDHPVAEALREPLLGRLAPPPSPRREPCSSSSARREIEPGAVIFERRALQPVLSARERLPLLGAGAAWLLSLVFFFAWWLTPGHLTTTGALILNSAVIGIELVVLPAWFFFFVLRMTRPNPALPMPRVRTAMIVTKAPSEPWAMVCKTLSAMLSQDYPAPYDVWLADEAPTRQVKRWCALHGIMLSSRQDLPEYHQPSWPRRTKCKEGNLAYFYDSYGYDHYDVVVQLDADHVPEEDYLRRMVGPFIDPKVGYVAAPSICDANADSSWSARGRLFTEAVLHGPSQAGSTGAYAPSCIGSHYAIRTKALKQIGGLGPELAEDFSTTLMMNAGGWRGVFALDAIAHGDGPECVADCVRQDFQWARSMTNIMLRITPQYWRKLTPRAKFKLGFAQLWYPLHGLTMLAMVVLPTWALLSHQPLMRVSLGAFYMHMLPVVLSGMMGMAWLRNRGLLRPVDGRPLSWEALLFQFVRWPWALLGVLQAALGLLSRREFEFKVTPKGSGSRPLPLLILLPYLGLAALALLPALLVRDAGAADGYYFWSLMNGITYLGVAVSIIVLHARENPQTLSRIRFRALTSTKGLAIATVGVAVLAVGGLHGSQAIGVILPQGQPALAQGVGAQPSAPWQLSHGLGSVPGSVDSGLLASYAYPVQMSPSSSLSIGVTTPALANNAVLPWSGASLRQLNTFEWDVRDHASIVMWYVDWKHDNLSLSQLQAVAARGSTPEVTWEPWDGTKALYVQQPAYSMRSIAAGRYDAYVRSVATRLREFGRPVLLRFAQEMNGGWYPWSTGGSDRFNTPQDFVAAWRHLHAIFSAVGAGNVRWVWSPIANRSCDADYPGDGYVDVVGLSAFNGGTALHWGGWKTFSQLFSASIRDLRSLAPAKPIQISETASAQQGGNKAAWISQMFRDLRQLPEVKSLLWFNDAKQTAWPVESSPAAAAAFANGLRGR